MDITRHDSVEPHDLYASTPKGRGVDMKSSLHMHQKRHFIHHITRGFTLLELLLYVSLSAILLGAIAVFLGIVLNARVKQQSIVEVEEQGQRAIELITHTLRNAPSITTPSIGTTGATLSVEGTSTITVDSSSGKLWYTIGSDSPIAITNSSIVVSGVQFYNLSRPQTPGIVRVQFTLTRVNPEGRNEYAYQQTFYASASLR